MVDAPVLYRRVPCLRLTLVLEFQSWVVALRVEPRMRTDVASLFLAGWRRAPRPYGGTRLVLALSAAGALNLSVHEISPRRGALGSLKF